MKKTVSIVLAGASLLSMVIAYGSGIMASKAEGAEATQIAAHMEALHLTTEWDKTFPKSDKVDHRKVTFINRFGITLAADLYTPKNASGKLAALAVCGPFGAVKEQSSGIYAQAMAERGFITLAVDPAFTGESGGWPRNVACPDICTEDFGAAVDFLSVQDNVDPERIGIIGVCAYGGFALNAAIIDTRVKATVASTMYDLSRMLANGNLGDADSKEARDAQRKKMSAQRTEDFRNGDFAYLGGVPDEVPASTPAHFRQKLQNTINYYRKRGYHPRSLNSNGGSTSTYALSFINAPILHYLNELDSAAMVVIGEKALNKFYSDEAYAQMKGDNKSLLVIPDAVHIDLYDNTNVIPFDKMADFFNEYLK